MSLMKFNKFIPYFYDYNFLFESISDSEPDVDYVYNTFFKKDIDSIKKTGIVTPDMFKQNEHDLTTEILNNSKECIRAHDINPCTIVINDRKFPINSYDPIDNRIAISINFSALDACLDENGILSDAYKYIQDDQIDSFNMEFEEHRIKGSIHHEIAHWVDDSLNNNHIKKRIHKQIKYNTANLKNIPVAFSNMEIHGQIHNIKQIYNKYKDKWDTMTFDDVINLSPSLMVANKTQPIELRDEWKKKIKKRMYREGLLGKTMINY